MADGMKSALELALERTDHVRQAIRDEGLVVSEEQREQLADLDREYGAKIAEKDVMLQAEMRKLLLQYPPAELGPVLEQLRAQFLEEKRKLMEEKEEKARSIRQAHRPPASPLP